MSQRVSSTVMGVFFSALAVSIVSHIVHAFLFYPMFYSHVQFILLSHNGGTNNMTQ